MQLDKYFQNIPLFTNLRLFSYYNKIVQWTKNEQKTTIKQLNASATFLLMQNILKSIYYANVILNFTMFAWYLLHNNEILLYMKHILYRLNKIKIAFENHCSINPKQFSPTFNYLKF